MLEKLSEFCAGVRMTAVSGVFLAISLWLLLTDRQTVIDPAWVTVIISGYPLMYEALSSLLQERRITSALLVSMAVLASLAIGELFAAGEVAFIMAIGEILEDLTVSRAKKGLAKLISLAPAQGRLLVADGSGEREQLVAAENINSGDRLRVLPGEAIPVDGVITGGSTSVDQSVLTGESLPVDKNAGDKVYCGTMNCFGSVDIVATGTGKDSSLQKLIKMVQDAESKKAPMQRIVDKWAAYLVPAALAIALCTLAVSLWAGLDHKEAYLRAVTVLVVFCPCALALATPTSVMAAIGQAAKYGVIIKSGEALEKMGEVDMLAFDKTGTLTTGKLDVSDVITFCDMDKEQLLAMAAAVESKSEHPLGKAIVAHVRSAKKHLPKLDSFTMEAGRGVLGSVGGRKICCGSAAYLLAHNIMLTEAMNGKLEKLQKQGKAIVLVGDAADKLCLGAIGLSDMLRPEVGGMVQRLGSMQIPVTLLTGDNKLAAGYFAQRAGIANVQAGLLPGQKLDGIAQMQQKGYKVCMIGDGVNDAPALKTADVGVAMGSMGSDIAVEAADIALMSDDISKIPYLKRLANAAFATIKKNIAVSMAINTVAVALSISGVLTPITGALVHNAGSVLVVLNAAMLYDRDYQ